MKGTTATSWKSSELFRAWKRWGLDAVYPALLQELDMTSVETDEGDRPTIPHESLVSVPLRIPFSVIRAVYHRWQRGELSDGQMVERYGEVWMVLFQLMANQGVSDAVRESLTGLVHWNVTALNEVNLLEEHVVGVGSEAAMRWTCCLGCCWRLRCRRQVQRAWTRDLRGLPMMDRVNLENEEPSSNLNLKLLRWCEISHRCLPQSVDSTDLDCQEEKGVQKKKP